MSWHKIAVKNTEVIDENIKTITRTYVLADTDTKLPNEKSVKRKKDGWTWLASTQSCKKFSDQVTLWTIKEVWVKEKEIRFISDELPKKGK